MVRNTFITVKRIEYIYEESKVIFGPFFSLSISFNFAYNFLEGWYHPISLVYLLEFTVAKFHSRWLQNSVVTTICFSLIQAQQA